MQLLVDRVNGIPVESLFSEQQKRFAPFIHGTQVPIELTLVDRLPSSVGSRIWAPVDISAWTSIQAAFGRGFATPVAGTFRIRTGVAMTSGTVTNGKTFKIVNFVAGDSFTNIGAASNATGVYFTATGTTPTTWSNGSELQECTTPISFDASAATIQTAVNAMALVTAAGSVVVSQIASGYFSFTWNNAGSRTEMVGDPENLAPLSITDFGTLVDGSTQLAEVQSLRIVQSPVALATLSDALVDGEANVDVVTVGGGGANHKIRVSIDSQVYDGQWTITIDSEESGFISFDADSDEVTAALEAMTAVGSGNVEVTEEQQGQWLIMFVSAHANENMGTITTDSSGLLSLIGFSGTLRFDNAAVELLLAGEDEVTGSFEIQGVEPAASAPTKFFRLEDITLRDSIIDPSSQQPSPVASFYTQTETDALIATFFTYAAASVSSAATTTLTKSGAKTKHHSEIVTVGAGGGAYTHIFALATTNGVAGDIVRFKLSFPASANPTIEVRDATGGGTLLYSKAGTGSAFEAYADFVYTGSAWVKLSQA